MRAGAATNDWTFDGRGFPTSEIKYSTAADFASTDPAVTNYFFYNERGELIQATNAPGGLFPVFEQVYEALAERSKPV